MAFAKYVVLLAAACGIQKAIAQTLSPQCTTNLPSAASSDLTCFFGSSTSPATIMAMSLPGARYCVAYSINCINATSDPNCAGVPVGSTIRNYYGLDENAAVTVAVHWILTIS